MEYYSAMKRNEVLTHEPSTCIQCPVFWPLQRAIESELPGAGGRGDLSLTADWCSVSFGKGGKSPSSVCRWINSSCQGETERDSKCTMAPCRGGCHRPQLVTVKIFLRGRGSCSAPLCSGAAGAPGHKRGLLMRTASTGPLTGLHTLLKPSRPRGKRVPEFSARMPCSRLGPWV